MHVDLIRNKRSRVVALATVAALALTPTTALESRSPSRLTSSTS